MQTCGLTSLIDDLNMSNLALGALMNQDQQTMNANLTTQTQVKFDCLELSIEDCPSGKSCIQNNLEDKQAHLKTKLEVPWKFCGSSC